MSSSLNFNYKPNRDYGSDWASYFQGYSEQLHERKIETGKELDPEAEAEEPAAKYEVLEPREDIDPAKLTPTIKKVIALLPGREIAARKAKIRKMPVLYVNGDRAGQVRYQAKDFMVYSFATVDGKYPIVSALYWDGKLDYAQIALDNERRTWVNMVTTLTNLLKGIQNEEEDLR